MKPRLEPRPLKVVADGAGGWLVCEVEHSFHDVRRPVCVPVVRPFGL